MRSLIHHLLGRTRATGLGPLLPDPERALHVRELARLTGASAGSLHRELRGLAALGLLLRAEIGRQVHYRANVGHPLHAELVQLLRRDHRGHRDDRRGAAAAGSSGRGGIRVRQYR